jgi:hypothetical protein
MIIELLDPVKVKMESDVDHQDEKENKRKLYM